MNPTMYLHSFGNPNTDELLLNFRRRVTPLPWERQPTDDRVAAPAEPIDVDEDLPLESAAAVDSQWRAADAGDLIALAVAVIGITGLALGGALLAG